jgi:hypothetical protein
MIAPAHGKIPPWSVCYMVFSTNILTPLKKLKPLSREREAVVTSSGLMVIN